MRSHDKTWKRFHTTLFQATLGAAVRFSAIYLAMYSMQERQPKVKTGEAEEEKSRPRAKSPS